MDNPLLFFLPPIAFLAFFLKAVTGFGPAIILISLASLFLPAKSVIATSAVLDVIAGAILFQSEGAKTQPRFLIILTSAMVLGTILGAIGLGLVSAEQFTPLLGLAILSLSIWFAFFRSRGNATSLRTSLPERCDAQDLSFSFLGGICGGLFGISGPPIIWHLGRRYQKEAFRGILITIFLVASLTRVASYSAAGMMDTSVLTFILFCIPGQLLGLYVGKRAFLGISERLFSIIVAAILFLVSVKFLWF